MNLLKQYLIAKDLYERSQNGCEEYSYVSNAVMHLLGCADNYVEMTILEKKLETYLWKELSMTYTEREMYSDELLHKAAELRKSKGLEYSRGEVDINSNFKRTGEEINLEPNKVLYIFMKKHWDSIISYIKNGEVKSENVHSRLADMINYLIILGSLAEEKGDKI